MTSYGALHYPWGLRTGKKNDERQNTDGMVSIFVRDIPREVRDRFKALCVLRGTTMRQALVEMMLDALEGSPIPSPKSRE